MKIMKSGGPNPVQRVSENETIFQIDDIQINRKLYNHFKRLISHADIQSLFSILRQ